MSLSVVTINSLRRGFLFSLDDNDCSRGNSAINTGKSIGAFPSNLLINFHNQEYLFDDNAYVTARQTKS